MLVLQKIEPSSKTDDLKSDPRLKPVIDWFSERGWQPFAFQREAWLARLDQKSGLIHVPTGAGKTFAAFLGALLNAAESHRQDGKLNRLRIVYISPLKAVARDIELALQEAIKGLGLPFRAESRTGDTSSHQRTKQKAGMPEVLVTTPESLALLIADDEHKRHFEKLETILLDEWHECIGNKRGSLLELTLTRLRHLRPTVKTWALTATISNTAEAAQVAVGARETPHIVRAQLERRVNIESLLPHSIDTFPWAGHLGLRMAGGLINWLDLDKPTLIFTNTRSQAERWYQTLIEAKPEWAEVLALHHGSLDRKERARVEGGVKEGSIRFVVATSSLDLGVDFAPVDRIVQIGSPKGIARLLQRAGRSGHRPGATSHLLFVPTHALELIEIAAVRKAVALHHVEARHPIPKPLDVLVQHMVTRALGGGFTREEISEEVRSATSFQNVSEDDIDWALAFIRDGGFSLQAYPSYRRVELDYGVYRVRDPQLARLHRMNIGTIDSAASIELKFLRGKTLGFLDEGFISKLKKGDRFLFSGRVLEFLGMRNMEANVKLGKGSTTVSPSWYGGRLPYSSSLSKAVRELLNELAEEREETSEPAESLRELDALDPILAAQRRLSVLPHTNETLMEIARTREGTHLFVYPFEGRLLHEGLAALISLRLSRFGSATFSIAVNDYGFEILTNEEFNFDELLTPDLFSSQAALEDLRSALDLTQLARQRFREIARVAGLIHPGRPSARKDTRQLQVSAGLLFDVFRRYEPDQPLILQAEDQVLAEQMENGRLFAVLDRISKNGIKIEHVARPTPFGFPLIAERVGARLSSESLEERIERMKKSWSKA
jgi:ATP-dependent Lhr-like helicase